MNKTTKNYPVPKKFGRYTILGELGSGNMGRVYLAHDPQRNCRVAIKLMQSTAESREIREKRFLREAKAMQALSHPNIVRVYDSGKEQAVCYFAMQYIDGPTLKHILEDSKPTIRSAVEIIEKVARAMHYAHQQNVLHRDLKPENIMLVRKEPIVMDFGLARAIDDGAKLTQSGNIVGTPAYMSPEQAQGLRSIDARVDVYSLGATLYHLLTGRTPFAGNSPLMVLVKVTSEPPPLPTEINPRISPDIERICLKALEKDPGKRFSSALELAEALAKFRQGGTVVARSSSRTAWHFKMWLQQHIFLAMALCCALSLLLSFGLWQTLPNAKMQTEPTEAKMQTVEIAWEKTRLPTKREKFFLAKEDVKAMPIVQRQILSFGTEQGFLCAFDLSANGKIIAEERLKGAIEYDPIVWQDTAYFASERRLYYLHEKRWLSVEMEDEICYPVVDQAGILYYSNKVGILYAVQLDNKKRLWKRELELSAKPTIDNEKGILYASAQNALYAIDLGNGEEVWRFKVASKIRTTPAIDRDTVFFANDEARLYAINRDREKEKEQPKWSCPIGAQRYVDPKMESSPIVADGVVYIGSQSRIFFAIDGKTGEQLWTCATSDEVDSTPILVDGIVYFGDDEGIIYAVHAKTGELLQRFSTRGEIASAAFSDFNFIYFGSDEGLCAIPTLSSLHSSARDMKITMYGLDDATKARADQASPYVCLVTSADVRCVLLQKKALVQKNGVFAGELPLSYGGNEIELLVGYASGEWLRMHWNIKRSRPNNGAMSRYNVEGNGYCNQQLDEKKRHTVTREIDFGIKMDSVLIVDGVDGVDDVILLTAKEALYAVDHENISAGFFLWHFAAEKGVRTPPVVADGVVYVGGGDNKLYAIDLYSGREIWNFRTGGSVDSPPIIEADTVYFGCDDDHLYAVRRNGSLQWKMRVDADIERSPAISGNYVYVTSEGNSCYCFDKSDGTLVWRNSLGKTETIVSQPVVFGDTVYFCANTKQHGIVHAVRKYAGQKFSEHRDWKCILEGRVLAHAPAVDDQFVCVGDSRGNLYLIERKTGNIANKISLGSAISSSPTITPTRIYISAWNFHIYQRRTGEMQTIDTIGPTSCHFLQKERLYFGIPGERNLCIAE